MPFALSIAILLANPLKFDFKDPKGVSAVSFSTDGAVEPFVGIAKGVSGSLQFDPAHPEGTSGKIIVESDSLELPMKPLEDSMKASWCLDAKGHPTIEISVKKLSEVKTVGNRTTALLTGDFTCKGVTKEIQVPASATYFKGKAKEYGEIKKRKKRNIKHSLIGFGHIFRPYYKYYLNVFAHIREKIYGYFLFNDDILKSCCFFQKRMLLDVPPAVLLAVLLAVHSS